MLDLVPRVSGSVSIYGKPYRQQRRLVAYVPQRESVDWDYPVSALELVAMGLYRSLGWLRPVRRATREAARAAMDLAFVLLLFKELNLTSFDAEFARALGCNSRLMHYALMVMVAVTIVAAFESVGSILVIAMLIVPGVVASLFTRRLRSLLLFGQGVALICAVGGHLSAITVPRWFGFSDTSTAGMMTVVAGAVVAAALVIAPERGLAARALHRGRVALAVGREDLLVALLRGEASRIAGRSNRFDPTVALLVERLRGRVQRTADGYRLTSGGRRLATRLLRSHRLWESYLFAEGDTAAEVHFAAHQLEHVTSAGMRADLARTAGVTDPHGRPIPSAPNAPDADPAASDRSSAPAG